MAFCHIYARRNGRFSVQLGGTVTAVESGGKVRVSAGDFHDEDAARSWITRARERWGLSDLPEPKVVRR